MAEVSFERKSEILSQITDKIMEKYEGSFVQNGMIDLDDLIMMVGTKEIFDGLGSKNIYMQVAHNYRKAEAVELFKQLPEDQPIDDRLAQIQEQFKKTTPSGIIKQIVKDIKAGDMSFDSTLLKIPYVDMKTKNLPAKALPKIVIPKVVMMDKKPEKEEPEMPLIPPDLIDEWNFIFKLYL